MTNTSLPNEQTKRSLPSSSCPTSPTTSEQPDTQLKIEIPTPTKNLEYKFNSLENIATKDEDPLKPARGIFSENEEINISFSQFKYIIENFSNKSINIHSLCDEANVDIPSMLKTIEIVRPKINDRATKIKLTKLSNLLFQSTPHELNLTNGLRASGGVASYAKTFFPSKQINLKTHLEAIAISIQLNETELNVCSLYLPNQTKIELSDIENITKQLPKPFIILGDFNAHCTMWGSEITDYRGKIIEKLLENDNIVILNDKSYLAQRINWKVLPDIYSSDHLPILTKFMTRIGDTNTNKNHRWNLKAPNWTLFSDIIEEEITKIQHNDHPNIEHPVKMLTDIITSAAEISIGSFINHNKKPKVPWWNDEIKRAISNKKNALNTYKKSDYYLRRLIPPGINAEGVIIACYTGLPLALSQSTVLLRVNEPLQCSALSTTIFSEDRRNLDFSHLIRQSHHSYLVLQKPIDQMRWTATVLDSTVGSSWIRGPA
ncbi:putative RNA-directed DNA polymerase [Aphis craccivora]|uniref:Putative RNA-directed DNA polymerase n=1 Tax=Aphis craccivora TaxID=307492 RepID=A0A6G0YWU7_APHCR|nr:putative RNA-directed DNA polymerase [Aphis craccivora]